MKEEEQPKKPLLMAPKKLFKKPLLTRPVITNQPAPVAKPVEAKPEPKPQDEDEKEELIPVVRSKYVNLEVHFKGSWKIFTCERYWSKSQVLNSVCQQLSIPQREKDQYDPNTVSLSLLLPSQSQTIQDFEGLEDGQKVLVEVKSMKPLLETSSSNVSMRASKPIIGGI